jgi:hypothetical protein
MMAAISSVVATGRRMKGRDGLMRRASDQGASDQTGRRGSLRLLSVVLTVLMLPGLRGRPSWRRLVRLARVTGLTRLSRRNRLAR